MNYNFYDNFSSLNSFNNIIPDNEFNNQGNNLQLYNPLEGYTRGNMFQNLYDPYKNYRPQKIKINSEQEEMMASIGEYSFAAHDLNLYLDVYPNNQEALTLFNKYRMQANELIKKYERKYGPINVASESNTNIPFSWATGKWPWEV